MKPPQAAAFVPITVSKLACGQPFGLWLKHSLYLTSCTLDIWLRLPDEKISSTQIGSCLMGSEG